MLPAIDGRVIFWTLSGIQSLPGATRVYCQPRPSLPDAAREARADTLLAIAVSWTGRADAPTAGQSEARRAVGKEGG